jgi:hypothetical protein
MTLAASARRLPTGSDNKYVIARGNEFGYANYEMIETPQIAVNPLTELSNQFSIELGLTEQQKEQIVPILKQEV